MAMIDAVDSKVLQKKFDNEIERPVHVRVFSRSTSALVVPGDSHAEAGWKTVELMREVEKLSDKINLEVINVIEDPNTAKQWGISLTPAISVSDNGDAGVRMLGFPARFEFHSLTEMITSAGAANYGLKKKNLERVKALDKPAEIKIFSTPG